MNRKQVVIISIFSVLSFLLGYSIKDATKISMESVAINSNDNGTEASANSTTKNSSNQAQATKDTPERQSSPVKSRPNPAIVISDIKSLLGDPNMMSMDFASFAESYNLIKELNEAELFETLNLLSKNPNDMSNMMPLMLILSKYAEFNPLNAIAYYESNITNPQLKMGALSGIMSSWAKVDPIGAYDWYNQNGSKSTGQFGAESMSLAPIFQGLAKRDIEDAILKLQEISSDGFKGQMAATGITSALKSKEEFASFLKISESLDNKQIQTSVLSNWAMRDPVEASEWIDSLEDKKKSDKYAQSILPSWLMSEGEKAADWYIERAPQEDKVKSIENVIQNWAYSDADGATAWAEKQGEGNNQKVLKSLVSTLSWSNPDKAISILEKIESKEDKQQLSQQIYNALKQSSPKKAKEFMENSPYKDKLSTKSFDVEDDSFDELPIIEVN
jgi:hypothetical protein